MKYFLCVISFFLCGTTNGIATKDRKPMNGKYKTNKKVLVNQTSSECHIRNMYVNIAKEGTGYGKYIFNNF